MKQVQVLELAYLRVSTDHQELGRQESAILEYRPNIDPVNIFIDKETGKNFERDGLLAMKALITQYRKLFSKDQLIIDLTIKELDRLGRNYQGIMDELTWLKEHDVRVRILEIPLTLIDVDNENVWVLDMTLNIIIEVYARLAQQEIEKKHRLIMEGIEDAKKRGVKLGRPETVIDKEKFNLVAGQAVKGDISHSEAIRQLGLKRNTYYKHLHRNFPEYENKTFVGGTVLCMK